MSSTNKYECLESFNKWAETHKKNGGMDRIDHYFLNFITPNLLAYDVYKSDENDYADRIADLMELLLNNFDDFEADDWTVDEIISTIKRINPVVDDHEALTTFANAIRKPEHVYIEYSNGFFDYMKAFVQQIEQS